MDGPLTIGVLSTFLGGPYFGAILTGVARAAAAAGGRVVAIQTLDAGAERVDQPQPPAFATPVAWRHLSGVVVLVAPAEHGYLESLRSAGKPLVVVSKDYPGLDAPVVMPDNEAGTRLAVEHLIAHGHRRIAFAGWLAADDVRRRYLAYRDTLLAAGITPDPALLFHAESNQEPGGDGVGRAMLDAGLPSTAVVAATDATAMGIMRTLSAAGYHLPRDQAVVGFDDMDAAAYAVPSLSSVRQPLDVIGRTAVEVLTGLLDGRTPPQRHRYVATSLVARESCGCAGPLVTQTGGQGRPPLPPDGLDPIVRGLAAAIRAEPMPSPEELRRAVERLYSLSPHLERVAEITQAVRAVEATADASAGALVPEMILALARAQARAQFDDTRHLQSALSTQYEVSMELLRSHEREPRTLRWLERTEARAGCLGLWLPGGSHPPPDAGRDAELEIAGTYARGRPAPLVPARRLPVSAFPPPELFDVADGDPVFVVPVKTDARDWGLLAVAGPIETRVPTGRETVNQWAALLAVALEQEAVLQSLREQEERLRRAALYDELTGLPNRALFVHRLRQAMERSRRRPGYRFAVLFVDLDGFKVVNDRLGHAAGDRLLHEIAGRISGGLREADIAARFGGDEFLVLLDDIGDPAVPTRVAGRLNASLARPFRVEGEEVVVTGSIGIALGGDGYTEAEDVLRDADLAMYRAKSREKGTHAMFDVATEAAAGQGLSG